MSLGKAFESRQRMSKQIAFIDFETANHQSNSACQIGVVFTDDWQIVDEREWMIRPQRMYFSPNCVRVHGITARDCMDSPQWDKVWSELFPLLDGRTIIAHNVGFDAAVLKATSEAYDIALPQIDLQCTRLIAKRTWPGQSGYGLAAIAARLAIQFQHHNALEDARACAKIAITAAEKAGAADLDALEETLGLVRGRIWVDQIRQPRSVKRSRIETVAEPSSRYQPKLFRYDGTPSVSRTDQIRRTRLRADAILAGCEESRPLAGKHVVLINSLLGMQREDAVSFLTQLGATVQNKINLQTHYVIMGTESELDGPGLKTPGLSDSRPADSGSESETEAPDSVRLAEIETRKQDGQPVRILSQRQLLACIPSALAIARGDL